MIVKQYETIDLKLIISDEDLEVYKAVKVLSAKTQFGIYTIVIPEYT